LSEHVDEARRNDQSRGVNRANGVRAIEFSDRHDAIAAQSNIPENPRISGAVNDFPFLMSTS